MTRTWDQMVGEAIILLSSEAYTITNFMYKMNVTYAKIKEIIQELEDREILEIFEKKSRSNRMCVHYKVKLPLNRLRQ